MKNTLVLFILLLPFFLHAKSYKGTIYYKNDNRAVNVEIQLPIAVNAKKLKVVINGQKQKIDANQLAYFDVYLNNGKDKYAFKRGQISHYKKKGGVRKGQNMYVWSMIDDVREHIMSSAAGLQYAVKKRKGKEYILIVFNPWTQGHYLSKPDSDILVATHPLFGESFEMKVANAKDLLFPECENIMEHYATLKKETKQRDHASVVMDAYEACLANE